MNTIYIIDIEPVETRYTAQWQKYTPILLNVKLGHKYNIKNISSNIQSATVTTPGAFLNFSATNTYKSDQGLQIFDLFETNQIKDGDIFLFTDAWNPIIIQLKYIIDLNKIDAKIIGLWHAGSYDPYDFLGRLIQNKEWSYNFERSVFHAIDINCFATEFHIELFKTVLEIDDDKKILRTGWPMEYLNHELDNYKNIKKENIILFPHRIAPEKQLYIFKDLEKQLPQYQFIVAQEKKLTKHEYHTLLGKSKIVFSASLQETLGITMYEGAILNAIPIVPNRLSYLEMYPMDYKYPSNWTEDFDNYSIFKDDITYLLDKVMTDYDTLKLSLPTLVQTLNDNFFSFNVLINKLK